MDAQVRRDFLSLFHYSVLRQCDHSFSHMQQVITNLRTGETSLIQVPAPQSEPNHLLIYTRRSLVSQGTERMLVQFGKANLWQKARSQPEKVRLVLKKIAMDGVAPTLEAVFCRLNKPLPLGYCNASVVISVGQGLLVIPWVTIRRPSSVPSVASCKMTRSI